MGGLFNKAQTYKAEEKLLHEVKNGKALSAKGLGIPEEEGLEILEQIDKAVSRNKIDISGDKLTYTARKNSRTLPLLVNIAALVAVTAGVLLFFFLFRQRESVIVSSGRNVESVEGSVIARLKQESQDQIERQESDIREARRRLQELSRERDSLRNEIEQRVQIRENELRNELEAELARERERLLDESVSAEEIERRLAELAAEKEREYRQSLNEYRESLTRELRTREEELAGLTARVNELETVRTEIREEYDRLASERQDRERITSQIRSLYGRAADFIVAGNLDAALETLDTLEEYVSRGPAASLTSASEDIAGDGRIIEALRTLIESRQSAAAREAGEESPGPDGSGTEISRMIEEGDSRFAAEDYRGAFEAYTAVVEAYPESDRIPAVIDKIETSMSMLIGELEGDIADLQRERDRAAASAEAAERQASAARETAAALRQSAAAGETAAAGEAAANTQADAGKQRALEALRSVREISSEPNEAGGSGDERSREEVYSLLQAKVRMKKIMDSDEIRTSYPDLYESMQNYYTAYGEEQWEEGSTSALSSIVEIMEILNDPEGYSREEIAGKVAGLSVDDEYFAQFLTQVERLIE